jgi:hypothetical protein
MDGNFDRDLFGFANSVASAAALFPEAAGFKGDAETGREAAEAMAPHLGRLQELVLGLVRERGKFGLTPEEAADLSGIDRVSLQPRFSELKTKGRIVDSGQRRLNPSSR